jgi:hypothetical protein
VGVGTRVAVIAAISVAYAIDLVVLAKWPDIKDWFKAHCR